MEITLCGKEGHLDYIFNYFAHPKMLNLYNIYPRIHLNTDDRNGITTTKDPSGRIRFTPNQKASVSLRIPQSLILFFWKDYKHIKFNEEKVWVDKDTLYKINDEGVKIKADVEHSEIIEAILKEDNIQLRRDFIALIKILSTPVDFPIIINDLVRRPTPGATSVLDGLIKLPLDDILPRKYTERHWLLKFLSRFL